MNKRAQNRVKRNTQTLELFTEVIIPALIASAIVLFFFAHC